MSEFYKILLRIGIRIMAINARGLHQRRDSRLKGVSMGGQADNKQQGDGDAVACVESVHFEGQSGASGMTSL